MNKLACSIPRKIVLACSGGRDSMSALDFLLRGRREVTLAHFNHGTPGSDDAQRHVEDIANNLGLECKIGFSDSEIKANEASWREARYDFFEELGSDIVMAHHLNDAVEWWIFTSFRGNPKLMPITRTHGSSNILRPFLFFDKEYLGSRFDQFSHVEDCSNNSLKHSRNRIRHKILPQALLVNPGLKKTVLNLYHKE